MNPHMRENDRTIYINCTNVHFWVLISYYSCIRYNQWVKLGKENTGPLWYYLCKFLFIYTFVKKKKKRGQLLTEIIISQCQKYRKNIERVKRKIIPANLKDQCG